MTDPKAIAAGLPPGIGIVYFGNEWFAENRTSSHHMARRLCGHLPLLYVDSPGMRPPTSSGRDLRRILAKLGQALRRPRQVGDQLWHCTVPQLPWRRWSWVQGLNRWFGAWAVRRAMRHAGIERAILWFVVPHPSFMLDQVPHEASVYYCIDDYAAHPGVDRQAIQACDEALTRTADHVFVAPPALVAAKLELNPHTTFSPHGVDVELFATAQSPQTPVPAMAAALRAPVIGYFGLIAAWTDVDMLAWMAQQRPDWQWLLVGHAAVDVSSLRALPNVTMAGAQPYESLPGWAKAFDVAIIPYRQNQQVRNANPLKLREYLATGKPIVSAPTPEVDRFGDLVRVASTPPAFMAAIETALAEDTADMRDRRMAAVRHMGWDQRCRETLDLVVTAVQRRQVGAGDQSTPPYVRGPAGR
ncbi:MAG: glycosyltransferase [Aquabacterium sp.]